MKLISKNTLPPGGWSYVQPETNMKFDGMVGFSEQVGIIVRHRKANSLPGATPSTVANDLEQYTCTRVPGSCMSGAVSGVKKNSSQNQEGSPAFRAATAYEKAESAASIVSGWLGAGGEPVDQDTSTERARICSACPYNKPASLFDLSKPAAAAIKLLLKVKGQKSISTPLDESLGVCEVCGCDLKTKVHTPIDHIVSGTDPSIMSLFPDGICWIRSESTTTTPT